MEQVTEQSIYLDLPSSLWSVYILNAVVSEILRGMGLDEETGSQLNLAVIEAGTNAIKHGNQEDLSKRAQFEFIVQRDTFIVVVRDEGQGFDRRKVPDPMDEANFFKSSGRGIFLMESCMDDVRYEKSGTVVKMVKKLKNRRSVDDVSANPNSIV